MKSFVLFIWLLILSMSTFSQNSYYWYKNRKIPLTKVDNKRFILLENKDINNVLLSSDDTSWKISNQGIDNTIETLIPYHKEENYSFDSWVIIENTNKVGPLPAPVKEQKFYSTPFFKIQEGKEVGLSHLFYVKLFKEIDIETLDEMSNENGVKIIGKNIYMPLWYTIACSSNSKGNALEIANLFYESGKFDAAEPDLLADDLLQCVNDTYFDDQWNLLNDGQYGGTSGIDINMCDAWEFTEGSNDIVVAVIDRGIELDHADLPNIFEDSYDTETNSSPSDIYGFHGTGCAGIIGAASDNNIGIAGIAPDCQLMSISNTLTFGLNLGQYLANGFNWARSHGASVISNSWGNVPNSTLIDNAIDYALANGRNGLGCVIIFASGNDNGSVQYPANSNSDIIAVGAMSLCGERKNPNSCDTENEWGSNYGSELDLVAPGVLIPTTDLEGNIGINPNIEIHVNNGGDKISDDYIDDDYTVWFTGTSAAAPHVAGVAALMLSVNPDLTQDEVRDIIESTCTKVGGYNYSTVAGRNNGTWHNQVGYGCLNAHEAVAKAMVINGPNVVCNSNTTYSIPDLPQGVYVQWTRSASLRVSGGSTSTSFTVYPYTTLKNDGGFVKAIFKDSLGETIGTNTKYLSVMGPHPSKVSLTIEAQGSGPVEEVCPYENYYFYIINDDYNCSTSNYDWHFPAGWTKYYSGNNMALANSGPNPEGTLTIDATTCCDNDIEIYSGTIYEDDCGGYFMLITPNPSAGETTLSIESNVVDNLNENEEWDLEVYTESQLLKEKKTKLKGKSTKIQTNGWQEGVYAVRVKYKDEVLTGKLVVKK